MDTTTHKVNFPFTPVRAFVLFAALLMSMFGSNIVHAQTCGEDHIVVAGESLSKISQSVYGDAQKWSVIYNVNLDIIGDDPNLIWVGEKLRIPCLEENSEPTLAEQAETTPDDDSEPVQSATETTTDTTSTTNESVTDASVADDSTTTEASTATSESVTETATEDAVAQTTATESNTTSSESENDTSSEDTVADNSVTQNSSTASESDTETSTEDAAADTSSSERDSATDTTATSEDTDTDALNTESSSSQDSNTDDSASATAATTESAITDAKNRDSIRFLTADDYAPFTDRKLVNGGMVTDMLVSALENNTDKPAFEVNWVNDWSQHLDPLLTNFEYDLGFPWLQPDCASAPDDYRCQNFKFSNPVIHMLVLLFTEKDRPVAFNEDSDIEGSVLCRPNGYYTHDLEKDGRLWLTNNLITLEQPDSIKDCFDMLIEGKVDAVALNEYTGRSAVSELSLKDRVVALEGRPLSIEGLHVVVHKDHPRAQELIDIVNTSMADFQLSADYNSVVDLHFRTFWSTID